MNKLNNTRMLNIAMTKTGNKYNRKCSTKNKH